MDNTEPNEQNSSTDSTSDAPSGESQPRPTTLNILVDNGLKSPLFPSFRTPVINDIQPILLNELDKLLQKFKSPVQTPNSFLNPNSVTEEQERFAK